METAMYLGFNSLPYPLFESEWEEISRYKELAVKKEEEILRRRQKRNDELLSYVANRLKEWGLRKDATIEQTTEPTDSFFTSNKTDEPIAHTVNHTHQQFAPPIKSFSSIPIRSPPKHIGTSTKRDSHDVQMHPKIASSISPMVSLVPHSASFGSRLRPLQTTHVQRRAVFQCRDPLYCITAVIKGYLTRRLLNCEKIQGIITTVKDAEQVLQSLDSPDTMQEFDLQQRVINQLHTAKLKLHHIFFELPPKDRMAYIAHSRNLRREKQLKKQELQEIKRKLSAATLKSIERKKKQSSAATPTATLPKKLGPPKKTNSPSTTVHNSSKSNPLATAAPNAQRESISSKRKTISSRTEAVKQQQQQSSLSEKRLAKPHPVNKGTATTSPDDTRKSTSSKTTQLSRVPQLQRKGMATVSKIPPPNRSISTSGGGKFQKQLPKYRPK